MKELKKPASMLNKAVLVSSLLLNVMVCLIVGQSVRAGTLDRFNPINPFHWCELALYGRVMNTSEGIKFAVKDKTVDTSNGKYVIFSTYKGDLFQALDAKNLAMYRIAKAFPAWAISYGYYISGDHLFFWDYKVLNEKYDQLSSTPLHNGMNFDAQGFVDWPKRIDALADYDVVLANDPSIFLQDRASEKMAGALVTPDLLFEIVVERAVFLRTLERTMGRFSFGVVQTQKLREHFQELQAGLVKDWERAITEVGGILNRTAILSVERPMLGSITETTIHDVAAVWRKHLLAPAESAAIISGLHGRLAILADYYESSLKLGQLLRVDARALESKMDRAATEISAEMPSDAELKRMVRVELKQVN